MLYLLPLSAMILVGYTLILVNSSFIPIRCWSLLNTVNNLHSEVPRGIPVVGFFSAWPDVIHEKLWGRPRRLGVVNVLAALHYYNFSLEAIQSGYIIGLITYYLYALVVVWTVKWNNKVTVQFCRPIKIQESIRLNRPGLSRLYMPNESGNSGSVN